MARSVWRDALDGKIKALRDMQHPASYLAIEGYLRAGLMTKGVRFNQTQMVSTAREYQRNLTHSVRTCEPFYLSHDMVKHFNQRTSVVDLTHVVTLEDLPVRNGMFWFPGPVEVTDSNEPEPGHSLFVRAIMFADAKKGLFKPGLGLRQSPTGKPVIGVTLFCEAGLSGFTGVVSGQLIPFLYQPIEVGQPLSHYVARASGIYTESHDLAHQLWGVLFLWSAFAAMQQRVVRFGGSGLERELRKQAKRAGVEPSVQVMEWRKAVYVYPDGHAPTRIDWSCQWAVRAHTRRLRSGKLVQVRAHVKGPEGKEFRQSRERFHVVDR